MVGIVEVENRARGRNGVDIAVSLPALRTLPAKKDLEIMHLRGWTSCTERDLKEEEKKRGERI